MAQQSQIPKPQNTAWGGQKNVTLLAKNQGIPPSIEKVLLNINKALRGFPPFLLND